MTHFVSNESEAGGLFWSKLNSQNLCRIKVFHKPLGKAIHANT
jgi:hypothetical protein